jgi:hypothetical protein
MHMSDASLGQLKKVGCVQLRDSDFLSAARNASNKNDLNLCSFTKKNYKYPRDHKSRSRIVQVFGRKKKTFLWQLIEQLMLSYTL